jgi:hypothetical protein
LTFFFCKPCVIQKTPKGPTVLKTRNVIPFLYSNIPLSFSVAANNVHFLHCAKASARTIKQNAATYSKLHYQPSYDRHMIIYFEKQESLKMSLSNSSQVHNTIPICIRKSTVFRETMCISPKPVNSQCCYNAD